MSPLSLMTARVLRTLRGIHGLKSYQMAEKLGVSKSYFSEMENGRKNLSMTVLEDYAAFSGLKVSMIIQVAEEALTKEEALVQRYLTHRLLRLTDEAELDEISRPTFI